MSVTLEVLRLSGWLNADAYCQVEREHTKRAWCRGCVGGSWGEVWAQATVQERSQLEIGDRARAEAHQEHVAHVRDAGDVETQRLVERRRLPSGER